MPSAQETDQNEVFAFLQTPATYGRTEEVTRIDTHAAAVFLAGPDVYKVKRDVRFAFLDFSTLAQRRAACEAEIAVNRDNAPGLYLGVVPITRDSAGLHLGGEGEIVEWAVHLRRFNETATLDRIASSHPLGGVLIGKLAGVVAAMHARAPRRDGAAATQALRGVLGDTVDELRAGTDLFASDRTAVFGAGLLSGFDGIAPLLLRRGASGQVRRCHGDLHLGNIVLIADEPVLFDAIEFDEAIATTDVLYDLAFLIMDLCHRDLRGDANKLLNRYLSSIDEKMPQVEGLATLPVFLSLRAAIRAKVEASQWRLDQAKAQHRDAALAYLGAGERFLAPVPPRLVAVGGLSGTGKSTLAACLAPSLGRAPGALHLRSDVERKHLFGLAETERLPADGYRADVSAAVHARLHGLAEAALRAGHSVILDATHQRPEERDAVAALAARLGVPFNGFWLEAPIGVLLRRVNQRGVDASDATGVVVVAQAQQPTGEIAWHRLDASLNSAELMATALASVGPDGPGQLPSRSL